MARAIDSSYLLQHKRKVKFFGLGPDDESWGYAVPVEVIEKAPTLTQPNEPLTLEQLQEMNGQPVWVEELNLWALVDLMYARGNELVMVLFGDGDIEVRNVELYNLHCYRRPPEEEV